MPIRRPGTTRRSGGARLPADGTVLFTRQMIGTGAPSGTVYVFAQAFARGRVSGTGRVVCRRASSNALVRTQVDVKTTWGDGSAKYALIAVELSGAVLANNVTENLIFEAGVHPTPGSDLTLTAAALPSRSASVTVTPSSGTPFPYDLLGNLPGTYWKRGPLVAEKRVEVAIPSTAMSGSTAGRLIADVWITANGDLFVDLCIANDAHNWPDSTAAAATIGASLTIDGSVVWQQATPVVMHTYSGGSLRVRGRTAGGADADYDPIFLRPAVTEMVNAGVSAPYNTTKGVAASTLSEAQALRAGAAWNDWTSNGANFPLRGLITGGPGGGNRGLYGLPFDDWGAAWMCGGHIDFYKLAMERAEAFRNSAYFHFDKLNGTWINNIDRPGHRTYNYGPTGGWADDGAHHPMVLGLPALLRGRRSIIDQINAYVAYWSMWAGYQVGGTSPGDRLWFAFEQDNFQIRNAGYMLCESMFALFMTPTNYSGVKSGWVARSLDANLTFAIAERPRYDGYHGELAGIIDRGRTTIVNSVAGGEPDYISWQQGLVVSSLCMLARQGDLKATTLAKIFGGLAVRMWTKSSTYWPLRIDDPGTLIGAFGGTPGNLATYLYYTTWTAFLAAVDAQGAPTFSFAAPRDTNIIGQQRMMLSHMSCAFPGDPEVAAACTAFDACNWMSGVGGQDLYLQSAPKHNFDRAAGFAVPGT